MIGHSVIQHRLCDCNKQCHAPFWAMRLAVTCVSARGGAFVLSFYWSGSSQLGLLIIVRVNFSLSLVTDVNHQ